MFRVSDALEKMVEGGVAEEEAEGNRLDSERAAVLHYVSFKSCQ